MGICHGKPIEQQAKQSLLVSGETDEAPTNSQPAAKSSGFRFYSPSPLPSLFKSSPTISTSTSSTPLRIFRRPFPPSSPAKHIHAFLARRNAFTKPNEVSIPQGKEFEIGLNKSFGFSKHFASHYKIDGKVGCGHFGYTCSAKGKKGCLKGQEVAVKVIP